MKVMQKYRVIFEVEAENERAAIHLVSQPDIMRAEAVMTIQNVDQRFTLKMALLLSPLIAVAVLIGYSWWGW